MSSISFSLRPEAPSDASVIDALHALTFGPGRFARTAFRLREGIPALPEYSFVALCCGRLVGSVRMTAITIGRAPGLLLGPLAVHPEVKHRGAGRLLVAEALKAARADGGYTVALLVGDLPYYGPLGFVRAPHGRIMLPGPVDPDRILVAELRSGGIGEAEGKVRAGAVS